MPGLDDCYICFIIIFSKLNKRNYYIRKKDIRCNFSFHPFQNLCGRYSVDKDKEMYFGIEN